MHIHEQFELLYFVSGKACCRIESAVYPLEPHTLLVMRQMEAHKMDIWADKPYERFALNFAPELIQPVDADGRLLAPFLDRPLGQNNVYTPADFENITPLDLFEAMDRDGLTREERRTDLLIYLYPLLGQLALAFSKKRERPSAERSGTTTQIVDYVNQHLFDDLSVEQLSAHFFLSVSQLERLFKKATGSSVWNYVRRKRLAAARQQILRGEPATAVSQICGFRNYSVFYRAYLHTYGVSPQQEQRSLLTDQP